MCTNMQTHTHPTPEQREPEQPLTHLSGQEDGGEGDQINIYESYILPKHIVVIFNRHASGCFQDFEQ